MVSVSIREVKNYGKQNCTSYREYIKKENRSHQSLIGTKMKRVSQKHLDQTDVDHNASTTEEMEYSGMTKATGEVTILDKNMPTSSIETNRTSNRTRKISLTRSIEFLWVN